ncbi:unnamed protein product [Paramecium sonneborni]|uniref:Uncharacterized protein n=1 Tax=Paramecium sonneborni TaxID=65129 RepID=A0A8S1R5V9_9CILI|nr:unnamed protein product [Paramecium sonneborni]
MQYLWILCYPSISIFIHSNRNYKIYFMIDQKFIIGWRMIGIEIMTDYCTDNCLFCDIQVSCQSFIHIIQIKNL